MVRPVFKTGSGRITPSVAGSIPALSANRNCRILFYPNIMKPEAKSTFRHLPSVEKILRTPTGEILSKQYGRPVVTYAIRHVLENARVELGNGSKLDYSAEAISERARRIVRSICTSSLKPVINATGIILHTNLGRAPLGDAILEDIAPVVRGYCNLEFDLEKAARGHRGDHVTDLLSFLTGAEGVVIVNNNAAGIILALNTLAKDREVIISRGELVEIGGAFRIPEIMAASGARMIEVGTTNRTRLSDYEQAITPLTAAIFKAHKSNYTIEGFTEEVSVRDLATFAHDHNLPFFYDIGSGLLRKPDIPGIQGEPDVQQAIRDQADLVMFSGDKLLGGPQAGIIAGRRDLVTRLARAPLMRALRVGKLTLAALGSACRHYINDTDLVKTNPLFSLLERSPRERTILAEKLHQKLLDIGIQSEIVASTGVCGGGTLPDLKLPSLAIALIPPSQIVKERETFAEAVFYGLLLREHPVLGILREGRLLFDVFALTEKEIPEIVTAIGDAAEGFNR